MNEIKEKILEAVSLSDYRKGLEYDEDYIDYVSNTESNIGNKHQFLVESESSYRKYMVQIEVRNESVYQIYCTCPQFMQTDSCKHVAACLITYSNEIFSVKKETNILATTKRIFQRLQNEFRDEPVIKTEVQVVPYLSIERSYYYEQIILKAKIGKDKLYSLLGKFNAFRSCMKDEESYSFGKDFVYDPTCHYFSDQSLRFFQFVQMLYLRHYASGNSISLDDEDIKELFKIYPEGVRMDENNYLTPIKRGFPITLQLTKDENNYKLLLPNEKTEMFSFTDDAEYILSGDAIYHLDKKQQLLFQECIQNKVNELVFAEEDFPDFQKSVLRVIRDNVQIDETVKDLVIVSKPDVKFYFDLNEDNITCVPKFLYDNQEVSYFDDIPNIVRDIDYENETTNCLIPYGFHKMNHLFLLDDFDLLCEFMDGGLEAISEKYPVFTSEKLKNTSVLKQSSVTTHFRIGTDQILHYDFDLGDIATSELDGILNSMKKNKKYYRLKNGDILSLEQEPLKELNDLTEELELSKSDIVCGNGTIPKYRALYLDSLKEKKYGIIETDSLFQKFINQFKEFQNIELDFTKEELAVLRDYQVDGVKWLYTVCKCGFGGILADEMGLGKSLQTITFIKKLLQENESAKFLIVCPTSLVYNWQNEFEKFAPELKFQVFSGSRNERRQSLDKFDGSIYITSYGLLREDLEFYQNMSFRLFVIDEAQNIKNPKTGLTQAVKSISSETKMALTGTPIENAITELWSIFDFIMPGFLSSLMKFQRKYRIKEFDEETNKLLGNLKVQVKPFILRRKKKDVVKDLPDKIENTIYIDLNEEQKKYYAAEVKYVNEEMDRLVKSGGFTKNKMMILALLTKLRQICIDPAIIAENYKGGSAKIESLVELIKEVVSNGHKILLFTSFKTALYIVKKALNQENISTYVIDGDVPSKKRQMLVDAFNEDNTNVFLIMLKSGGTGLNLTSADVVIHLDLWWNPQAENQATDRTHRIGQKKTVEVIKMVCKGTIEEKILALQEKKKILSDKMIEEDMDDNAYLKKLSEEDIRDLLAYENKE